MILTINCPSCKRRLLVKDDGKGHYTCPRCLASFSAPVSGEGIQELPARSPVETIASGPPPTENTCPGCKQPVEPHWRYCPVCDEVLIQSVLPADRGRRLDVDIRRDQRATSGGMVVLTVFGVIGIIGLFYTGVVGSAGANNPGPFFTVVIILGILMAISAGIVLGRNAIKSEPFTLGTVMSQTVRTVGALVLVVFGVGFAAFVILFVTCLAMMAR